jgi:hypothetical protein
MNNGRWFPCYKCKHLIYMESGTEADLRKNGHEFFCLWGHGQVFRPGKTDLEKMQEELDAITRQRDRARQENARLAEDVAAAERRARAAKGQATKLRKRAAAGVCPCCNRTFQQLASHMAEKHPGFISETVQ